MKQGVLVKGRVRLLMGKGSKNYRPRRVGERKRKSVRGCIVGPDIRVLAIAIIKKGENHIPGLTNETIARKRGPKRVTRIRKLFNLKKEDDVRNFVVRRKIEKEGKKVRVKAPKIQRLVTEKRLRRKRMWKKEKLERISRRKKQLDDFHKVLVEYKKQKIASRKAALEEVKKPEEKAPKKEAPKTDPKKTEKKTEKKVEKKVAPTTTQPTKKKDEPKPQPAKVEAPKAETKKAPQQPQPKKEAPKQEAPKQEAPKKESKVPPKQPQEQKTVKETKPQEKKAEPKAQKK